MQVQIQSKMQYIIWTKRAIAHNTTVIVVPSFATAEKLKAICYKQLDMGWLYFGRNLTRASTSIIETKWSCRWIIKYQMFSTHEFYIPKSINKRNCLVNLCRTTIIIIGLSFPWLLCLTLSICYKLVVVSLLQIISLYGKNEDRLTTWQYSALSNINILYEAMML